jgi:hypothetical protein
MLSKVCHVYLQTGDTLDIGCSDFEGSVVLIDGVVEAEILFYQQG